MFIKVEFQSARKSFRHLVCRGTCAGKGIVECEVHIAPSNLFFPCCSAEECRAAVAEQVRTAYRKNHPEKYALRKRISPIGRLIVYSRRLTALVGFYEVSKMDPRINSEEFPP